MAEEKLGARFERTYSTTDYRKHPWFSERPTEFVAEAVRSGRVRRGRSLDLGCGAGTLALWLARQGYDAFGIDFSPSAVAVATRRAARRKRKARFRVASALDLPFPRGFADLVTDIGLVHTLSPPRREVYASELARVLKPGGDYLTVVFAREDQNDEIGPPYRLSVGELMAAFESALEVQEVHAVPSEPARDARRFYAVHLRRRRSPQPGPGPLWR
ncbi:MAG: class I SAM-dependent methyltransferase [Thermoplasmata archaeon]|nr:class I SAM-dependent methyltransferase [Thermoplasmata archaeon]